MIVSSLLGGLVFAASEKVVHECGYRFEASEKDKRPVLVGAPQDIALQYPDDVIAITITDVKLPKGAKLTCRLKALPASGVLSESELFWSPLQPKLEEKKKEADPAQPSVGSGGGSGTASGAGGSAPSTKPPEGTTPGGGASSGTASGSGGGASGEPPAAGTTPGGGASSGTASGSGGGAPGAKLPEGTTAGEGTSGGTPNPDPCPEPVTLRVCFSPSEYRDLWTRDFAIGFYVEGCTKKTEDARVGICRAGEADPAQVSFIRVSCSSMPAPQFHADDALHCHLMQRAGASESCDPLAEHGYHIFLYPDGRRYWPANANLAHEQKTMRGERVHVHWLIYSCLRESYGVACEGQVYTPGATVRGDWKPLIPERPKEQQGVARPEKPAELSRSVPASENVRSPADVTVFMAARTKDFDLSASDEQWAQLFAAALPEGGVALVNALTEEEKATLSTQSRQSSELSALESRLDSLEEEIGHLGRRIGEPAVPVTEALWVQIAPLLRTDPTPAPDTPPTLRLGGRAKGEVDTVAVRARAERILGQLNAARKRLSDDTAELHRQLGAIGELEGALHDKQVLCEWQKRNQKMGKYLKEKAEYLDDDLTGCFYRLQLLDDTLADSQRRSVEWWHFTTNAMEGGQHVRLTPMFNARPTAAPLDVYCQRTDRYDLRVGKLWTGLGATKYALLPVAQPGDSPIITTLDAGPQLNTAFSVLICPWDKGRDFSDTPDEWYRRLSLVLGTTTGTASDKTWFYGGSAEVAPRCDLIFGRVSGEVGRLAPGYEVGGALPPGTTVVPTTTVREGDTFIGFSFDTDLYKYIFNQ